MSRGIYLVVDPKFVKKLLKIGIKTREQLLERGKTTKGRKEIAKETGISTKLILDWVNNCKDILEIEETVVRSTEKFEEMVYDSLSDFSDKQRILIHRWNTSEGIKIKQKILKYLKENKDWTKFLKDFPYSQEVKNGKDLRGIYLKDESLFDVDLSELNCQYAFFKRTKIWGLNLKKAGLQHAIFEGVYFDGTSRGPTYEGVKFEGANLKSAIFIKCNFYNIRFYDNYFDPIIFQNCTFNNVDWGNNLIKREYFQGIKPRAYHEDNEYFIDYFELKETYLSLKNQFFLNGRYNDMSWAYLKEKESLRLHYKQNITHKRKINIRDRTKNFFKFIWEYFLFFLFGYGEKPWHILGWSVLAIITYALIYKITNAIGSNLQDIDTNITFWRSLYFSTITFTTVGFGDFHPLRDIPRILVMTEAAIGLFFYSLFIFTFGRRTAGR